jgi:DNA-binding IclR family transcriptional regulator
MFRNMWQVEPAAGRCRAFARTAIAYYGDIGSTREPLGHRASRERSSNEPAAPPEREKETEGEPVRGDEVPVRSVARAIDLVMALEDGPSTLGALATTTHLSKGTAHRLLTTLAAAGLVIQDPATATYALGPACFGILDAIVHGAGGLDVIAGSILTDLSAETGETVALYVRAGPQRICVAQAASSQPIRYAARLGMENPVYAGAMGKVLLAFSDRQQRNEILDRVPLVALTARTITDRSELDRELEAVRKRGLAESHGERSTGAGALSAPVFDGEGRMVAALSILGPDDRMTAAAIRSYERPLLAASAALGARLAAFAGATDGERPAHRR